jgi:Ca2+/Na+ antiporter
VATLAQFPAIGAALVACWLAIPLWFGAAAQSAQRRAAIQTALAINAYFLLFATMQVALPRYSTVVEPYLVVLLVLLAAPKTIRS